MPFYEENPNQITKTDIVVGIPSFNEAETIGFTTEQVSEGLTKYFGNLNSVIINCDNNSADGTRDAFFSAACDIPRIYLSTPPNVLGKGNNVRNLLDKSRRLEAGVVAVVEADIRNISPRWVQKLVQPILNGAGYVSPIYVRHKYEDTFTSSIIYPLTRCLYGRRVRQPSVGEFGLSGRLLSSYLEAALWTPFVEQFGIDIWMTTIALNARVPICQAVMGSPKMHRLKDPHDARLPSIFRQVLSTIFDLMEVYESFWRQVKWSKPTALFGVDNMEVETPVPVELNLRLLHERFLEGFDWYGRTWEKVYGSAVFNKLQEICGLGLQHFSLPSQTWARILFDTAAAYKESKPEERLGLLDALLPLYFGKVLTFVKKTERMSIQQAEEYVENECMIFEENKPYLATM